jgi:hypothetical protein
LAKIAAFTPRVKWEAARALSFVDVFNIDFHVTPEPTKGSAKSDAPQSVIDLAVKQPALAPH